MMLRDGKPASLTVAKLGGSLAHSRQCELWLGTLAAWGGPLILVPGGGPFADCVRAAQRAMRFSDAAAHRMALMAMGQFGIALAALSAAYTLAASRDELDGILRAGRIPIWLPEKMALDATSVPASWEVTSDSLAAWLAGVYGARRLLLIKSRDVAAPISALELADAQIVDPAFPRFAAKSKAEVWLAGPASLEGAVPVLQGGSMPGISVAVEEHGLGV